MIDEEQRKEIEQVIVNRKRTTWVAEAWWGKFLDRAVLTDLVILFNKYINRERKAAYVRGYLDRASGNHKEICKLAKERWWSL